MNQTTLCKSCEGSNCNLKKNFQKCIFCNSKDDVECTRNMTNSPKTMECDNFLSTCLTGIDDHGVTHRRCSKNYDEDKSAFQKEFVVCANNTCNTDIYPPNRLQCYMCNGQDECDFMPTRVKSLQPQPCRAYSKFDQCYAYLGVGEFKYHQFHLIFIVFFCQFNFNETKSVD